MTEIYYGRYITADILQQIYHGRYITADTLRQIYYGRYVTPYILRQVITADMLWQIRYGRYIASNTKGYIPANLQRQKHSIAASEPACCNASPQGLPWTVLSTKRPPKSKQQPPITGISVRCVPLGRNPTSQLYIIYVY